MRKWRKRRNRVGGLSLLLLLVTACAAEAGLYPLWLLVLGCVLGCAGLVACRLVPRIVKHRRVQPAMAAPAKLPRKTAQM